MRGIHLLTAHRMSCMGATSRFRFFDLIVIRAENPCSHSHVEEKISSWGIAWEASVEYEEAMLSQKFIGEQSLCFIFVFQLSIEQWEVINDFMGNFIGSAVKGCQEFKHSVFLAFHVLLPEVQLHDKRPQFWNKLYDSAVWSLKWQI